MSPALALDRIEADLRALRDSLTDGRARLEASKALASLRALRMRMMELSVVDAHERAREEFFR